jgi:hypothetical protein
MGAIGALLGGLAAWPLVVSCFDSTNDLSALGCYVLFPVGAILGVAIGVWLALRLQHRRAAGFSGCLFTALVPFVFAGIASLGTLLPVDAERLFGTASGDAIALVVAGIAAMFVTAAIVQWISKRKSPGRDEDT